MLQQNEMAVDKGIAERIEKRWGDIEFLSYNRRILSCCCV